MHGIDPEPMGASDVQYTGTLNLAHTPNGLRLVQVESTDSSSRVERLKPNVSVFDGEGFGNDLLKPAHVITATLAQMSLVFPAVRFVCRPDELAFTGTESV